MFGLLRYLLKTLSTIVLGVILLLAGLGFVVTAYSLFLEEQVHIGGNVTHSYKLIMNNTAWLNSGQHWTCVSCPCIALCNYSTLGWEVS